MEYWCHCYRFFLHALKKENQKSNFANNYAALWILPISIFLLGGFIDTLINYTNFAFLPKNYKDIFPLVLFSSACIVGFSTLLSGHFYKPFKLSIKDLAGGVALGIPNYFSLFFLIRTLEDFRNDGAVVFPVVNIGVIVIASLLAVILFKEKLSFINLAGISFALIAIVLIFW